MPFSVDQFGKALVASGLLTAEEVKAFWAALPTGQRPKDGETLAKLLVREAKLTKFQAQELITGGATPLVLGDYVLLAKIGAGGMGQVFKAHHRRMKRLAAIKLLPPDLTKDEAAIKRFEREVEAAAKLSHANIVQTYDAGVQRGVWYLVMEYVEGRDLASTVNSEGPLPVERAINYVRQAAKGLAFAHSKGVVHRDIKPANLLLDSEGTVKILDMGLARIDDAAAKAQEGLTQSGQVMGTVDYMAPEQAFDTKSADARADIYSLGCTLYRLLTGQNIYDGESIVQKLMAHQSKPIPALAAHRKDVPAQLVKIFERMVAKRPEDRYPSMAEAEAALAALEEPPTSAGSTAVKPEADSKLTTFMRSLTGAKPAAARAPAAARTKPTAPPQEPAKPSPTISVSSPLVTTDPVSERSIQVARENTPRPVVAARVPAWRQPAVMIAGGAAAGLLLLVLGIWVIVRDKDGNELARIKVPDGGTATITGESGASATGGHAPPRAVAPFKETQAKAHQEAWARYLGTTVETTNSVGQKMILIPPGEFLMGSTDEQVEAALKVADEIQTDQTTKDRIQNRERPQHKVVITKPFLLSATEVTVGQFKKFSAATGYQTETEKVATDATTGTYLAAASDDLPAAYITWNDATAYCQWLSTQEKTTYRLPNEAEWEYACRAGTTTQYSFGDDYNELSKYGWQKGNAGNKSHPVGTLLPNPFGLFDMHGNVGEWCGDYFDEKWYTASTQNDPNGPGVGSTRVIRGGSWPYPASSCRGAYRNEHTPSNRNNYNGFRVVAELDATRRAAGNDGLADDLSGEFAGHRYLLVKGQPLWAEAKLQAEAHGGHLVTITSREENEWIKQTLLKTLPVERSVWIGAEYFPEASVGWTWVTGEPWDYEDWGGVRGRGAIGGIVNSNIVEKGLCWNSWPRDKRAIAQSGPLMGQDRTYGYIIEWDSLSAPKTSPPPAVAPFDAAQARTHQEAWAKHLGTQVETVNSVGQKMLLIPPGEFLMGSSDEQVAAALKAAEINADQPTKDRIQKSERPQHKVAITKPFLLSATEVTIGQFKNFAAATGYQTAAEKAEAAANAAPPTVEAGQPPPIPIQTYLNPGYVASDNLPAAFITWKDAAAYCKWLSEQEKRKYRLPTEAEWEYACRAGTTTQFSFGDDYNELSTYGWHSKNAVSKSHPVGTLLPNGFGLFDMHGNLYEWCGDYYYEKWYSTSPPHDPNGPSVGSTRVIRGGYWRNSASGCRSAYRNHNTPSHLSHYYGFRVVAELEVQTASVSSTPSAIPPVVPPTPNPAPIGPQPPPAVAPFDAAQAKAHQQAWAAHLGTQVETVNRVGQKMILIPPGEFLMGSTDEQLEAALEAAKEINTDGGTLGRFRAERPQHKVVLTKPFLMSATEVTVGQFREFVEATKYVTELEENDQGISPVKGADSPADINWRTPGYDTDDQSPVAQITWNDAVGYCQWLTKVESPVDASPTTNRRLGLKYRLPTEAEWEYACRAGTTTQYSFGDDHKELPKYGWYSKNANDRSQPVGKLLPNNFGLFDMHGNLFEWCGDWYDEKWYERSTPHDPVGPTTGSARVLRGGFWNFSASSCRSAHRNYPVASTSFHGRGFRVVAEW